MNILDMNKILVIVAHPDDEVLGMGGTIARLSDMDIEVHILIITDGSISQYRNNPKLNEIIENKKHETSSAAEILGVKSVIYGDLPDMMLDHTPHIKVNQVIENAVEVIKPDTVFTHFWGDVNLDHVCVYHSTLVAVRPTINQTVKKLYCYSVPSSTEWSPSLPAVAFMPNTFVDISKYVEQKEKALMAYKTEIRKFPHPRSAEYIRKQDEAAGLRDGISAAEMFILLRSII